MQDKGYRIDRDRIVYFFLTFITAALYIYTCKCTAIKITISVTRHGYSVLTLSLFTLSCAFCTLWSDTLRYTWSNTAISSHNDGLNSPLIIHHRQLICFFLLLLIHFRRLLRMTNYFFFAIVSRIGLQEVELCCALKASLSSNDPYSSPPVFFVKRLYGVRMNDKSGSVESGDAVYDGTSFC